MIRRWLWTAGWCAVMAAATATRTAAAEGPKPLGPPAAVRDADALAAWIDEQFAADWRGEPRHARRGRGRRRVPPPRLSRPDRPHPVGPRGPRLPGRQEARQAPPARGRPARAARLRRPLHQLLAIAPVAGSRRQRAGPLPDARLRGVAAQGPDEERRLRPDGPRAADGPDRAGRRPRLLRAAATTPRPRTISPRTSSRRTSAAPPPASSSASRSSAPSATTTRSATGSASSSGATPPSSPESSGSSRATSPPPPARTRPSTSWRSPA